MKLLERVLSGEAKLIPVYKYRLDSFEITCDKKDEVYIEEYEGAFNKKSMCLKRKA